MKMPGARMDGRAVVAFHRQGWHAVPGEECGGGQPDQAAADDKDVGLNHHARPGFGPITLLSSLLGAVGKTGFPFFGSCTKYTRDPQGPASIVRRGGRVVECTALEMRHTGNRIGGSNPSLSAS